MQVKAPPPNSVDDQRSTPETTLANEALVEPPLIEDQRTALRTLLNLVAERAEIEPRIDVEFNRRNESSEAEFDEAYQDIIVRFATEKDAVERELKEAQTAITSRFDTERTAAERQFATTRARILSQYDAQKQAIKSEFQETRWTINAVHEGSKSGAENSLNEVQIHIANLLQRIKQLQHSAREFLEACRLSAEEEPAPSEDKETRASKDAFAKLQDLVAFADSQLVELRNLSLPRYFKGERILWASLGVWLLSVYPAYLMAGWVTGLLGSAAAVLVLALATTLILYFVSKAQAARYYVPLCEALTRAEALIPECERQARTNYQRQMTAAKKHYSREVRQAAAKYRQMRTECLQKRATGLKQAQELYRTRKAEIKERRTTDWNQAAEKYRKLRTEIQVRYEADSKEVQDRHTRQQAGSQTRHEREWNALVTHWRHGMTEVRDAINAINQESRQIFPPWDDPVWKDWVLADTIPPVIRFGEYEVDLAHFPNGIPRHERLKTDLPTRYSLPALVPFPQQFSLLFKANEEGRVPAAQALQAVMFRLLTAIPAGKVRFTIIDPVGLGQNFASFMHLADYDEALVTTRIWTEVPRIEQRLADLTEHMENVIQKYLRNQLETIEEYNVHAGEVAEPYRILVVANFPVNFTTEAARRLVSIALSGPRCGVYTLVTVDTRQIVPQGFDMKELEQAGAQLLWKDGRYRWDDPDFMQFPLRLDAPPPEELCTPMLRLIGQRAKDTKRVEVPFDFVAPTEEQWWTGDTRSGINVPLGRVGATKRQFLKLGQGTAQHVLIAGKTGSGKSTLLHALVSNLSLLYSPDEVELYLVDFKKGVEFKTYATHELPHARVVAIESEREFGLSVLQRLDQELRERATKYRAAGAQDIASYRQATGNALPRILLVVDEFQEFFVEDDKLAQDAALLMDRLVRQGRAFGLHVLLGSQTLGGAYSLARSTIDQMAVRIALQCSEADGHLILSEDNSAARLLSRPGEAIYNDANGLVEGNNPFQVVWLADDRREQYLNRIQDMARQHNPPFVARQIIFEGNAAADVDKNPLLQRLLTAPDWPAPSRSSQAWLGEAVAIKDPTAAVFRSQSGNNLLLIGQDEDSALGIMTMALVSLAAQSPPTRTGNVGGTRFYILDGSPDDAPHSGFFTHLQAALPHTVQVAAWRELPAIINELASEVERRQKNTETSNPEIYLLVYGLHRFRDLRRAEDDYGGFSRGPDDKPNSARQFDSILRDGPGFGMHTMAWCDSLNNLNRTLERVTLREFELRILFQMGAGDSSTLIDTPMASKLGVHRALFLSEDQGKLEKFRPYGVPSQEWLDWMGQQLHNKS